MNDLSQLSWSVLFRILFVAVLSAGLWLAAYVAYLPADVATNMPVLYDKQHAARMMEKKIFAPSLDTCARPLAAVFQRATGHDFHDDEQQGMSPLKGSLCISFLFASVCVLLSAFYKMSLRAIEYFTWHAPPVRFDPYPIVDHGAVSIPSDSEPESVTPVERHENSIIEELSSSDLTGDDEEAIPLQQQHPVERTRTSSVEQDFASFLELGKNFLSPEFLREMLQDTTIDEPVKRRPSAVVPSPPDSHSEDDVTGKQPSIVKPPPGFEVKAPEPEPLPCDTRNWRAKDQAPSLSNTRTLSAFKNLNCARKVEHHLFPKPDDVRKGFVRRDGTRSPPPPLFELRKNF